MEQVLDSLASPVRREILRLVWNQERAAGEIAAHFEQSFGAISQQLSRLRRAGLVDVRVHGRRRLYRARRRTFGTLGRALEKQWRSRLLSLKQLAEQAEKEQRHG